MKKIKIISLLGLSLVASTPLLLLTSCGQSNIISSNYAKVLDATNYNGTYTSLYNSDVSLEQAMYGSNYNDGNYIFLYGTTGSSDFRNFLYGPTGNSGSGTNGTINEQNFSTSSFINNFFSLGQIGNGLLAYSVKILTFVDLQPYDPTFIPPGGDSYTNGVTPFDIWTSAQVLSLYNGNTNTYTIENLPLDGKAKIGSYVRYDDNAVNYRESVNYLLKIRPNISGIGNNNKNAGLICFKKDYDPKTFDVNTSSLSSIVSYYTNK